MMDEGKSLKEMPAQIEKTYSKYERPRRPSYPLSDSLNCRCQPRQKNSLRLPEKIALLFPLLTNNFLAIRVERIIHGQFSFKQLMIIAIDKPETFGNRLEAG